MAAFTICGSTQFYWGGVGIRSFTSGTIWLCHMHIWAIDTYINTHAYLTNNIINMNIDTQTHVIYIYIYIYIYIRNKLFVDMNIDYKRRIRKPSKSTMDDKKRRKYLIRAAR